MRMRMDGSVEMFELRQPPLFLPLYMGKHEDGETLQQNYKPHPPLAPALRLSTRCGVRIRSVLFNATFIYLQYSLNVILIRTSTLSK